jgi:Flp pilus assembly protein TadG
MRRFPSDPASEQGAILAHVAFALLALMALMTFVVDEGVYWESRRQAQNSADAAALAGALALAGSRDFTDNGPAKQAAYGISQANVIWGAPPNVIKKTDITFSAQQTLLDLPVVVRCPLSPITVGDCITVDVYRTLLRGNPLPVYFGSLVGFTRQDVKASATAQLIPATASRCLAPIVILDKSPTYMLASDLGAALTLTDAPFPGETSTGFHGYLNFGGAGAGGVSDAIRACLSGLHYVGEDITGSEQAGVSGGVQAGVNALMALDPFATWDMPIKTIANSCVLTGTCYKYDAALNYVADPTATISPRVLALPVADLGYWTSFKAIKIVNFLGFLVTGTSGASNENVNGIVVTMPGELYTGAGVVTPAPASAFVKTVTLIR